MVGRDRLLFCETGCNRLLAAGFNAKEEPIREYSPQVPPRLRRTWWCTAARAGIQHGTGTLFIDVWGISYLTVFSVLPPDRHLESHNLRGQIIYSISGSIFENRAPASQKKQHHPRQPVGTERSRTGRGDHRRGVRRGGRSLDVSVERLYVSDPEAAWEAVAPMNEKRCQCCLPRWHHCPLLSAHARVPGC